MATPRTRRRHGAFACGGDVDFHVEVNTCDATVNDAPVMGEYHGIVVVVPPGGTLSVIKRREQSEETLAQIGHSYNVSESTIAKFGQGDFSMSSEEITQANSRNFFVKLWRGDVPLWKTYWLYGVLGGVIFRLLSPLLTYVLVLNANILSRFDILFVTYIFNSIIISYSLVILVCIWRSAGKYGILHPDRRRYASLARGAVCLGVLYLVAAVSKIALNEGDSVSSLSNATSPDEKMQYQALISGLNAELPKMIDSITRLDKIDVNGVGYIYYETVTKELDNKEAEQLLNNLKPIVASGLCKNTNTFDSLNSGLSYKYIYTDSKARPLGEITVTKSDCSSLLKAPSLDEKSQYQALNSKINADLPKMIDAITRLDKIDIGSDGYIYHETLIKELDKKQTDRVLNDLRKSLPSSLCGNAETLKSLNAGLSYRYIYSDSKAQLIGQLTITKSACAP